MKNNIWIYLVIVLLLFSCKPDDAGITFMDEPEIELLGVSPTQVVEFQDSINFEISYTDGDGDLGSSSSEDKNLFIVDERIEVTHGFRIQNIIPGTGSVPISGTLTVTLPNTLITDNSNSQKVSFTIYIVDRAGNESNRVSTPEVTVVK